MSRARTLALLLAAAASAAGCGLPRRGAGPRAGGEREQPFLPRLAEPTGPACGIPMVGSLTGLLRREAEPLMRGRLAELGFLEAPGPATPRSEGADSLDLEKDTRAALLAFQRARGLPATGMPSYATVRALGLELRQVFLTRADLEPCPPALEEPGRPAG